MNALTFCAVPDYSEGVANKDATGFDSSIIPRRTSRHAAIILFVLPMCAFFNGGLGGEPQGSPGSLDTGLSTCFVRHPHLTVGSGFNTIRGAHHA